MRYIYSHILPCSSFQNYVIILTTLRRPRHLHMEPSVITEIATIAIANRMLYELSKLHDLSIRVSRYRPIMFPYKATKGEIMNFLF